MSEDFANAFGIRGVFSETPKPKKEIDNMIMLPEVGMSPMTFTSDEERDVVSWTSEIKTEHLKFKEMVRSYVIEGRKRAREGCGARDFIDYISVVVL
jgi:hypothetical protein